MPQVSSSISFNGLNCKSNGDSSLAHQAGGACYNHGRLHEAAASSKQRIRWTTELHDLFLDAVKALGGPESKTLLSFYSLENFNAFSFPMLNSFHC